MQKQPTGQEIVASLAGNRPWWKLTAGDVEPWVRSLHPSAVQELASRTEWIGDAWDGVADIPNGTAVAKAKDVARLLSKLRRGIKKLTIQGVALPDASSVRQCLSGYGANQTLALDIDFGEFILPLGIQDGMLAGREKVSVSKIAASMLGIIAHADKVRARLVRRELRMRRAFEDTVARIGHGAAPLWLRLEPYPFHWEPAEITNSHYVMLIVVLDECLAWSPVGDERIWTVRDIRDHHRYNARRQKPRAAALAELQVSGSQGWIDETALAIIEEKDLKPADVFREAAEAVLADRRGCLPFTRNGKPEHLYFRDGRLEPLLMFEGGTYSAGRLSLRGDFPESMGIAAVGRELAEFVDHPAFRANRIVVKKAEVREGVLDLLHDVRCVSVEEAQLRSTTVASTRRTALAA